jgi:outer membrane biosynthesis protein TonB
MATTIEQQSSNRGFLISGIIHGILFLLLFFVLLENPPKQDAIDAVILDFGDSEEGTGGNSDSYGGGSVAASTEVPTPQNVPTKTSASIASMPTKTTSSNTLSSFDAEAVALEKQKKIEAYQQAQILKAQKKLEEQQKKEAAELLKKQQEEQAYKDAVASSFKKGKTSGTGGSGSGSGSGTGNGTGSGSGSGGQGNNGGSGSGSGFGGGGDGGAGSGTGTDYSLSGRSLLGKKVPFNNSQKSGKIVVQIKVGKDGNVLFAQGPYKGSTSTDAYLVKISEEAAYKFKFSANNDAAEEQFGTITFNYTFN